MKKISFPLFLKILIFFIIILGVSLTSYVYYAVDLFKTDKISYVYELVDDESSSTIKNFNQVKENIFDKLEQYKMGQLDHFYLKKFIERKEHLLGFFEVSDDEIESIISKNNETFRSLYLKIKSELSLGQNSVEFKRRFFIMTLKFDDKIIGFIGDLPYLLNDTGNHLYQKTYIDLLDNDSTSKLNDYIVNNNKIDHTFFYNDQNQESIISVKKVHEKLVILTIADYRKVVAASERLVHNSIYFAGIVLGIVLVLILLFTNILIKPVKNLTTVAREFLQSNFQTRAETRSKDEIGFLASTFNQMADDINQYMMEVEDKIKMEKELETAKLVQSQFFPQEKFENPFCEVFGQFKSAGQCGGDWWGVLSNEEQTLLIVADVTGHGTPAALMTAVLYNAAQNIKLMSKFDKTYLSDTSKAMGYLNDCFCQSTKSLNATAFIFSFDHEARLLTYTNASHNAPFLINAGKEGLTKKDLIPLMENNGKRLGEDQDSSYELTSIALSKDDKIVLYSDGLLEELDSEEKPYGQRRFIKALLNAYQQKPEEMIHSLLKSFYDTVGDKELADDLTLVSFEVKT